MKSHLIRVFVNRDLDDAMSPRTRLIGSHAIAKVHPGKDAFYWAGEWETDPGYCQ